MGTIIVYRIRRKPEPQGCGCLIVIGVGIVTLLATGVAFAWW